MSVLGRLVKGDVGKDGGSCEGDGGGGVGIDAEAHGQNTKKLEDALNSTRV